MCDAKPKIIPNIVSFMMAEYRYVPHNDVSVNNGLHTRYDSGPITLWYYNIILYYYNTYHCVTIVYSIQYSNMLYRFVA
jgi:hypothetical protein